MNSSKLTFQKKEGYVWLSENVKGKNEVKK